MFAFVGLGAYYSYRENRDNALSRARENFQKDVMVRMLINQPGGGYALPDERNAPDPHKLDTPDQRNRATGDMPFAMGNPAHMTQFMHDLGIPVPSCRDTWSASDRGVTKFGRCLGAKGSAPTRDRSPGGTGKYRPWLGTPSSASWAR